MNAFQFATIFAERRKGLGLTQEDVAQFVGVSRAAVSKWEKGLSYPDITLLPKLAMYFDLSIDALLGYEPQLTKERIAQMYGELAGRFAVASFEVVEEEIEKLTLEYYSCYPFLMKMAGLLLNYLPQSPAPETTEALITKLCERIKNNTEQLGLLQEANVVEASLHLMQQRPERVLELLGTEATLEFNHESLIASALVMLQQTEQAKQVIQVNTYQKMLVLIDSLSEGLMLEVDKPQYVDETVYRTEQLITLFNVEKLNINVVLVFYIRAAMAYAMQGRPEQASDMLACYLKVCLRLQFPLKLMGDEHFYVLQQWMEQQQSVMQQAPRDEQSIKRDLLAAIEQSPLLAPLLEQEELAMLFKNVQHYLKEA